MKTQSDLKITLDTFSNYTKHFQKVMQQNVYNNTCESCYYPFLFKPYSVQWTLHRATKQLLPKSIAAETANRRCKRGEQRDWYYSFTSVPLNRNRVIRHKTGYQVCENYKGVCREQNNVVVPHLQFLQMVVYFHKYEVLRLENKSGNFLKVPQDE